ncbi:aldehyde dehydrogenase [Telmatospirillum sp.]|uniref:aldehyde dehydrogenase n=1 Tax=Telmatospirillum sp. TaxID=2079197 RepID=UPI00284741C7|nr:aldehyde dehydrogenase [Telmatospirillum sp.]MDR3440941.1 aldehyde dehydrogenase [Telmatospirillum sp.]
MKAYKQFIDGALREPHSHGVIEVENPFTQKIAATVPNGDAEDGKEALQAAAAAQPAWAARSAVERAGILKTMAATIREHRVELAKILMEEQAKIAPLAQVEIDVTAEYFDYYAGWARIYEGEIVQSDRPTENILLFRKPIGVSVGICPWNFPFFVMARKVAPALLTGNTVVIKPSSLAPNTIMAFAELLAKRDLPKGIVNFVTGAGATLGEYLVRSPVPGIVSLTGSVEAGQKVIAGTAENITKTSLELGGKAPAIVCADADLDLAVKAIVASRVIFSGQVCNCAERVYVDKKVEDQFIAKVRAAMKAVTYGDPATAPDMSSQIDRNQQKKIAEMVERASKDGAEILVGGQIPETKSGYFFEPTVLGGCRQDMEIIRQEVFGPVLPVVSFTNGLEEAIALANDCDYGLTSSIFTTNLGNAMLAMNRLKFGETYINREHFEAMQGFHAGWRKSGVGGADGKHGLFEYLQTHVVYVQW